MSAAVASTEPIERTVEHADGTLQVVERAGEEPAIVLMHGFPDDHHIYDCLAPLLAPRRVVAFDWLGYGRSGRREKGPFDGSSRQQDLSTVIDQLGLQKVVLVGHDAAGPEAIEYALRRQQQIAHLVLRNTYYGRSAVRPSSSACTRSSPTDSPPAQSSPSTSAPSSSRTRWQKSAPGPPTCSARWTPRTRASPPGTSGDSQ